MPDNQITYTNSKAERDTRLFVWFMTLIIAVMYAIALHNNPPIRQPMILVIFTVCTLAHLALHWVLGTITKHPSYIPWYIFIQGVLAFIVSALANNLAMLFALFMALIGEGVGIYGLKRQGVLSISYYLILLIVNIIQLLGWDSSQSLLLGLIPMVVFVVMYVSLYMRQNDAREQAQALAAKLEAANRQLTEYAAQVEDLTITNERQRMARELHDTLSQGLAGLILQLEAADAHLTANRNNKAQSIITSAMEQARTTLADARHIIDDLRQPSMDDLDSALRRETDRFTEATGIPVHYQTDQTPPLPDSTKEILIRAVAESLANIAQHANAQTVEAKVEANDQNLSIMIMDDGQGFDSTAIPTGHYGILGIKERIRLVNGKFEIQSENGKGTILKIEIPIRTERSIRTDEASL